MKRKISTLIAMLLAVVCVLVGVVACGEPDEIPLTYSVSFTGGEGATGTAPTMDAQTNGAKITLPANTFSKVGYTFANWGIGSETYAVGASYTIASKNAVFTAQWTPNPHTITYALGTNAAEGATAPGATATAYDAVVTLPAAPTAAAGYVFAGWKATGDDALRAAGSEYKVAGDVTMTAQWVTAYTVTYNAGTNAAEGVTAPAAVVDKLSGTVITLPEALTAAEGYVFAGWKVAGEETLRAAGSEYTITANVTITAEWTQLYTVTYYKGAYAVLGEDPASESLPAGATLTFPANAWSYDKKVFVGYVVQKDDNGAWVDISDTVYQVGDTYEMPAENIRVKATWTDVTVTVIFNAGKGTGTMANASFAFGKTYTLPACDLTAPENGTFYAWAFEDGTEAGYANDLLGKGSYKDYVDENNTLTLYAVWLIPADINDFVGTWTEGTNKVAISTAGAGFDDSFGMDALGTAVINGQQAIKLFDGQTGDAVWGYDYMFNMYIISIKEDGTLLVTITDYDGNVQTMMEAATKAEVTDVTLADFVGGWKRTDKNVYMLVDGTVAYRSLSMMEFSFSGVGEYGVFTYVYSDIIYNTILKAGTALTGYEINSMDAVPSAITYEAKGIYKLTVGGTLNQLVVEGTAPTASKVTAPAAPEGQVFDKWVLAGTDTAFDLTANMTADASIEASYKAISYTITFKDGDSIIATAPTNATGWIKKADRPADPTKANCTFKHWSLTIGGEAIDLGVYYFSGDTDVYAVWEEVKFTVEFMPGKSNATGTAPETLTLFAGETITFPANPWTAPYANFLGYKIKHEVTTSHPIYGETTNWEYIDETVYAVGATYTMPAKNIQIFGAWETISITVHYDANGGTGEMADSSVVYGNRVDLAECTFTAPAGKIFAGWAYADGTEITNTYVTKSGYDAHIVGETLTIKAIWVDAPAELDFTAFIGRWTNGGAEVVVSAYGAGTYSASMGMSSVGTAVLGGNTLLSLYDVQGTIYALDDAYNLYIVTLENDTLTAKTASDVTVFTSNNKSEVTTDAQLADFTGGWTRLGSMGGTMILYVNGTDMYHTVSLGKVTEFAAIGEYGIFVTSATARYVVKVSGDTLVGGYNVAEKATETVNFTKCDIYALTVEGTLNQLVVAGTAPKADKVTVPTAPEGEKFDKWVLAGTDTAFDLTANMTADASIEAKFVADAPAESTDKVYVGSFEKADKTVVKVVVTDYENKVFHLELSDGTVKAVTNVSQQFYSVTGAEKEIAYYCYGYAQIGISSLDYGFAFTTDGQTIYIVDSSTDEVITAFHMASGTTEPVLETYVGEWSTGNAIIGKNITKIVIDTEAKTVVFTVNGSESSAYAYTEDGANVLVLEDHPNGSNTLYMKKSGTVLMLSYWSVDGDALCNAFELEA